MRAPLGRLARERRGRGLQGEAPEERGDDGRDSVETATENVGRAVSTRRLLVEEPCGTGNTETKRHPKGILPLEGTEGELDMEGGIKGYVPRFEPRKQSRLIVVPDLFKRSYQAVIIRGTRVEERVAGCFCSARVSRQLDFRRRRDGRQNSTMSPWSPVADEDRAVAGFDCAFDDGEAEAGASCFAGTRGLRPEEWFTQAVENGFGNTGPSSLIVR